MTDLTRRGTAARECVGDISPECSGRRCRTASGFSTTLGGGDLEDLV